MNIQVPVSDAGIEAAVADLITRAKGLDNIHDDVTVVDVQTDGLKGNYGASDATLASSDAEVAVAETSYTKKKEFVITCPTSHLRIYFEIRKTADNTYCYGKVYKNGVAFSGEASAPNNYPTFDSFTYDLTFRQGDLIQLYAYRNAAGSGSGAVKNFRIQGVLLSDAFV